MLKEKKETKMNRLLTIIKISICPILLLIAGVTIACRLEITNDMNFEVVLSAIGENNGGNSVTLAPGQTDFYGQEHESALFYIYKQELNTTPSVGHLATVQQYACGVKKSDTQLKISDFLKSPLDESVSKMFIITIATQE